MNTNTQEVREYLDLAAKCTRHFHPVEWENPEKRMSLYKDRMLYIECAVLYHAGMTVKEMKAVLNQWFYNKVVMGH